MDTQCSDRDDAEESFYDKNMVKMAKKSVTKTSALSILYSYNFYSTAII